MKKINIVGFKTFPNKVNVELIKGINAFVGPNGCGKSNLVDAIRWGLGEQNPYTLRGTRMEDIIFAGTSNRKPLGMAEVTLTLDNQDSHSPTTFSEISITRRLFRSGESEYLINRTPVRLKDIQEIFAGTGLGAPGYSFLSQDMVEFVILSKPRERRLLFEEVAGISQFKSEKQKILKNIEKARENLIRVQDITGELERQLKYIKRQASKARKFKNL
ncbi:MAG: AAA family ATPase, partial [Caldiserica bacterium]|nr:AAA family ATPase [Caldisericota bacterium]